MVLARSPRYVIHENSWRVLASHDGGEKPPTPGGKEGPALHGADGTDVTSWLSQPARAISPLLELCAPRHGNTDVVTSKASLICHLDDTTLILANCDRQKTQKLKSGVFQLCEPVRVTRNQVEIVDSVLSTHGKSTWFRLTLTASVHTGALDGIRLTDFSDFLRGKSD